MDLKEEKKSKAKQSSEKSRTDVWRELERAAHIAEAAANEARRMADQAASDVANDLITNHGGATVDLDGKRYAPKKSATRKLKDDTIRAPRFPYQLVSYSEKPAAEF